MAYIKETATLVPKPVFIKAKELHAKGQYEDALRIIQENRVEFDIYTDKDEQGYIGVRMSNRMSNLTSFHEKMREEKKARWKGNRNANL